MDTTELLKERGKTHGEFGGHAACTQEIKRAMQRYPNWHGLTDIQREALEMIAHKLGRILTGDPGHQDHWDDIAGYAKLVSDRLSTDNGLDAGFIVFNDNGTVTLTAGEQLVMWPEMRPTPYLP